MKNKELQQLLQKYPANMPVKLLTGHNKNVAIDFDDENILLTSEDAYIDSDTPEGEWDTEDGKVVQRGKKYLLINPIIL